MLKKILSLLTLTTYLTTSIALPVFAGETVKYIESDTTVTGDVTIDTQNNAREKTGVTVDTRHDNDNVTYHVTDDNTTSVQEGNLTVESVHNQITKGLDVESRFDNTFATAIVDNNVTLNVQNFDRNDTPPNHTYRTTVEV